MNLEVGSDSNFMTDSSIWCTEQEYGGCQTGILEQFWISKVKVQRAENRETDSEKKYIYGIQTNVPQDIDFKLPPIVAGW